MSKLDLTVESLPKIAQFLMEVSAAANNLWSSWIPEQPEIAPLIPEPEPEPERPTCQHEGCRFDADFEISLDGTDWFATCGVHLRDHIGFTDDPYYVSRIQEPLPTFPE